MNEPALCLWGRGAVACLRLSNETTGEVEDTPAPAARAGFSDEQVEQLRAKLDRARVKKRDNYSYIEGWWAIREANRIFGFDGWSRETVRSDCVYGGEYEKTIWENGRKTNRTVTSYRCSYRAKVRITVGSVIREGSGHGHGYGDNPGDAHESAEKEAETDAMKRALMTFGNPFGLALYDKTQTDVALMPAQQPPVQPQITNGAELPSPAPMTEREADVARANMARISLKDAIDAVRNRARARRLVGGRCAQGA